MDDEHLLNRRARGMGPAYRLFYEKPLHLVRGEGVWLFDAQGNRYLDCYNNVASMGHCHPRIVAALSHQASVLNTHTRYLHENVVRLAERLSATLPGELSVCMFTCTGTEANELAFRIAREVTGRAGALVMENAYHGNSVTVSQLSTEDYPAERQPDYLAAVEAPNGYRGRHRYDDPEFGENYAAGLTPAMESLEKKGVRPAMFISDNIFSSSGILTPPPEYLQGVYRRVREAGGLCVADEVQSGFCRLGDHTWGFEDAGVIPDIVTMGKPMGNGHPLAAVVTTPAIAETFARRNHYFNTFGGNPVSAAVGLAVLDVISEEGMLSHVGEVGAYVGQGLQALAERHELIGDIRGKGLFHGIELVRDRESKEPAESEAVAVREYLREHGVLLGTTGPQGNVVKIRPPLVFSRENADLLIDRLETAFATVNSSA